MDLISLLGAQSFQLYLYEVVLQVLLYTGAEVVFPCDMLNIFKKPAVQKNPTVLTGYKRCSEIRLPPNQSQGFCMVIVCTGTHHQRRIGENFVELSFQCSSLFLFLSHSLTHSLTLAPSLSFLLSLSLSSGIHLGLGTIPMP